MVSHDGGSYLPRTLAALTDQTRPADAAIGVDTASRDNSAQLLRDALGEANVTSHEGSHSGFGSAVAAGLAALAPPVSGRKAWTSGRPDDGVVEWIWLLHDDSAPAPDALSELLHAVERAPSVTVAGCKQLGWHDNRRLLDVGLSTSRWAGRLTLIETDEVDQGQYDARTDTLAVNSAGMLVRRDVWDLLGGFDPALPGSGDDIDFGWRNWLAGNRVVVVPAARIFHVEDRPGALGNDAAARKAQVHLRLKHTPWWNVPFQAAGAFLGGLFRLVLGIVMKEPGHGMAQFGATLAALLRPAVLLRARSTAARTRRVQRSVIRTLQPSGREIRANRPGFLELIMPDEDGPADSGFPAEEPSGDADDFTALASKDRGWIGTGAVIAAATALVASLVGLLGLWRASAVTGGGLLPLSFDAGEIWDNASTWWIGLGAGLPGHGDPFGYVLWLLSLAGAGDGNAAMVWFLILAMPLAGLAAWFASGALTSLRRFRLAAALMWAGAPALQIALNQGRAGALVAHVMMPLLLLALLRASGMARGQGRYAPGAVPGVNGSLRSAKPGVNGTPSWTAAAAAGLVLATVAAAAPSLLGPLAAAIVLCAVVLGRRGRTLWWSLLPSAALFVPYWISALDRPRSMLADPGMPLGFEAAPLWQQVLGQPLKFELDGGLAGLAFFAAGPVPWALLLTLLLGVPVLLLAAAALFVPGRRTRLARAFWAVALGILAFGWLVGHVATGLNGNVLVGPFTGPIVSASVFFLLGAALLGAEMLFGGGIPAVERAGKRSAAVRAVSVVAALALAAGPLAGMTAWAARNLLQGPGQAVAGTPAGWGTPRLVQAVDGGTLPATAVDRGQGPERTRTLIITAGEQGSFTAALMRGSGTTLDQLSTIASARFIVGAPGREEIADDDAVTASIRSAVATIVAGTGVDPRPALERLGAGFIVLKASDDSARLTASRIDAVPGLVAVGQTGAGWLWRVSPPGDGAAASAETTHRARILDAQGRIELLLPSGRAKVETQVPAGTEGRLVVLAERSDAGWKAWLDGRELKPATSGWAQAFEVPAQAGTLKIRYTSPWEPWLGVVQAAVIVLTVLLAIPMPARRRRNGNSPGNGNSTRGESPLSKEYSSV